MMFQIKNKKHHPKGWCFSELAFRANSPGAEDGTCPPAGGAVVRKNSPPDCFLTRTLRIRGRAKQKRTSYDVRKWRATQDSNLRPTGS